MKKIKFTVPDDGSDVKIEVDGVSGSQCLDLTDGVTKALGGVTTSYTEKPSMYEQSQEEDNEEILYS